MVYTLAPFCCPLRAVQLSFKTRSQLLYQSSQSASRTSAKEGRIARLLNGSPSSSHVKSTTYSDTPDSAPSFLNRSSFRHRRFSTTVPMALQKMLFGVVPCNAATEGFNVRFRFQKEYLDIFGVERLKPEPMKPKPMKPKPTFDTEIDMHSTRGPRGDGRGSASRGSRSLPPSAAARRRRTARRPPRCARGGHATCPRVR